MIRTNDSLESVKLPKINHRKSSGDYFFEILKFLKRKNYSLERKIENGRRNFTDDTTSQIYRCCKGKHKLVKI